jgi:hypothetical protein
VVTARLCSVLAMWPSRIHFASHALRQA